MAYKGRNHERWGMMYPKQNRPSENENEQPNDECICPDGECWESVCDTIMEQMNRPSENEAKTWHEHDPEVAGAWAWGVVCDECRAPVPVQGDGPYFNIRHLKRQNLSGMSTRMEEREALGDRWDDPRVGRAN